MGTAAGGNYEVNRILRVVAVGGGENGPIVRAAFRDGMGCAVVAPDQDINDINALPQIKLPPPSDDPAAIPWPMGDRIEQGFLPAHIDPQSLKAASDWTFDRDTPEQDTLSLLIVYRGDLIHERYAPGVNMHTRTRTWSTAKSIAATLIGILVDGGKLQLDASLGIHWLPQVSLGDKDPREAITLRHVLNHEVGGWQRGGLPYLPPPRPPRAPRHA